VQPRLATRASLGLAPFARMPRPATFLFCCFALAASLRAQPTTLPLAGEWRFALDRADAGVNEAWFNRTLPDRIVLPGILQAQGYGDDIAPDTPWVLGLGDAWWKLQSAELRAKFSAPGRVEVPFLSQPPKHYLGAAWYQRDLNLPAGWSGRRIGLFLERAHWETTVWLNDRKLGSNNSLVAPHEYDLGLVAPGRHRLTIRVDNRQIVRDPVYDFHQVDAHAISDALGAAWNGLVGRLELRATSPVWIDDAQVFPDVTKKTALVRVSVGNATGRAGAGTLTAGGVTASVTWDVAGGHGELTVLLGDNVQMWDEFHPVLQHLTVRLAGPDADDTREITFGLREITASDKDLVLNGRVVNLRTTHFGGDFPLTGYPAMDVESWRKIIRACQAHGLNGMRFHSWCPPEAAFTAADELGFYLQPELGLWAPFNPGGVYTKYLGEETPRVLRAYGNHPSFVLFSPSNEPGGNYEQVTPQWAKAEHEKDPRRLYSAGTGWFRRGQVEGGAQYAVLVRYGTRPRSFGQLRNVTGWFGRDFRAALADAHIPVLAHEVGQWSAYPDFDVIAKFTGYMRPSNYDIFRFIAEQNGVLEYNRAFALASGRFQLMCYKEEIEANLRTPGLAGFQLLDLHDYLGQGTALVGLLDAFWEPKGYVTPAAFRRFSGPTVPLARLARRTFTTAETLAADVELYHFAEKPLAAATPRWKITDAAGRTVLSGEWSARDIPIGKNIPLGRVEAALAALPAPAAYQLVVGLKDTAVENDWNFWLYPAAPEAAAPASVFVTSTWADAEARLAAGGRVVFTPAVTDLDPARSPPMKPVPVFWNIQMTVRPPRTTTPRFDAMLGLLADPAHPALAQFPTTDACDWQWTPLIDNVRSVNLTGLPRGLKPIVAAIDDWNRNWRLGVIFECAVGPGRLLVSAIPLDGGSAGSRQLRRSLLDYAAGYRFAPAVALTPAQVRALFPGGGKPVEPPGRRPFDPDLDDGSQRPPAPPAR
jgi:beta-galactosidase